MQGSRAQDGRHARLGVGLIALAPSLLAFIPGVALGTWLNNLGAHAPFRFRALNSRTACPRCGHSMSLLESVSLLSYATRRGRCSHCGAKRAARGAVLELVVGLLAIACFAKFGLSGRAFVAAAFCGVLVLLATIDFERRILPNAIVVPAGIAILVADIVVQPNHAVEWIVAAVGTGAALLALALIYPGGLGMGDVKLGFLLGAGLGKNVILGLAFGFFGVFFPALYLIATRGMAARKQTIPLGPFLAAGAIIALFVS